LLLDSCTTADGLSLPFGLRVTSGDCDCGEARGDSMGSTPPEELAALLAENVAPDTYDTLLVVVAGAIDGTSDEEARAFCQAVYDLLAQ
jgi:hypothetical protein